MIPRTGARLRDHPRRANVSTTGAGAGVTNLKTTSIARNATTNPLMMRPAQRAFFETGAACVSDGMNFPPYVVRTKNQQMTAKHTKPQTAADDDPDACTSASPTPPALAAQRSYADAWCTPAGQQRQTGRPIRTTAPVPFQGPVHPAPQDPSLSSNSGASVCRSQAPSASPSAQ